LFAAWRTKRKIGIYRRLWRNDSAARTAACEPREPLPHGLASIAWTVVAVLKDRHQGRGGRGLGKQQQEITMAQIGTFTRAEDGSYTGTSRRYRSTSRRVFAPDLPAALTQSWRSGRSHEAG
jgi:hypothetical protein